MSIFDSDPSIGGPSFEELNLYNELILRAGELAEAFQSTESVASDRFYRVSDPLLMEQLTIGQDVGQLGHILPDERPSEVAVHSVVHINDGILYGETNIHIDYKGERYFIREDDGTHYLSAETPDTPESDPSFVVIDARATSDLLARLCVPHMDPELCDFTQPNDVARINEISALLESNDLVDGSIEHTHALPDNLKVVIETKKEALVDHPIPVSIEVTKDFGGKIGPLCLSVEFTDYRSALGMLRLLDKGSEAVNIDVDHMRNFNEIITNLLRLVNPSALSIEEYDTDELGETTDHYDDLD